MNPLPVTLHADAQGHIHFHGNAADLYVVSQYGLYTPSEHNEPYRVPYPGMRPFYPQDALYFFGRQQLSKQLYDRLYTAYCLCQEGKRSVRLLPVLGPAGIGKSSLVNAGFLCALARHGLPSCKRIHVLTLQAEQHPLKALSGLLATILARGKTVLTYADIIQTRLYNPENGLRNLLVEPEAQALQHLVIVLDQFEALYHLCDDEQERECLIENLLLAAADPRNRVSVVLTLRSDALRYTQQHRLLYQTIAKQAVLVTLMRKTELQEAITGPAKQAGYPLEESIQTHLIAQFVNSATNVNMALLQFSLTQVWLGMRHGLLPIDTINNLGGLNTALAYIAQRAYDNLTLQDQRLVKHIFMRLIPTSPHEQIYSPNVALQALADSPEQLAQIKAVVAQLAHPNVGLLVLTQQNQNVHVRISHEMLWQQWTLLREWLTERQEDFYLQRRLNDAVKYWDNHQRLARWLWQAADLALLKRFVRRAYYPLTALQQSFFKACLRRQNQQFRLRWLGISALLLLTMVLGAEIYWLHHALQYAEQQRLRAEQQQQQAEHAKKLATQAQYRAEAFARLAYQERDTALQTAQQAQQYEQQAQQALERFLIKQFNQPRPTTSVTQSKTTTAPSQIVKKNQDTESDSVPTRVLRSSLF